MNSNWAEVRNQMDQMLELEQAQRRASRRQRPSLWQAMRRWRPFSGGSTAAPGGRPRPSLTQHAHE